MFLHNGCFYSVSSGLIFLEVGGGKYPHLLSTD